MRDARVRAGACGFAVTANRNVPAKDPLGPAKTEIAPGHALGGRGAAAEFDISQCAGSGGG